MVFLVRKNDDKFVVKIESTNEEFTINERASQSVNESDVQSFDPLLDSAYRRLEELTVTAAWQGPNI